MTKVDALKNRVDFVITAPEEYGAKLAYKAKARLTLGVLTQIIAQAKRKLIISAPFFQVSNLLAKGVIADAFDGALARGVSVLIISTEGNIQLVAPTLIDKRNSGMVSIYQPKPNLENNDKLGSHAKFYIADDSIAYLGSANFTHYGIQQNLEMGVCIQGELVKQIVSFVEELINDGFFVLIKTI